MTPIESIDHPDRFKVTCDAILRHEMGPLVQTYGARGSDKGVDAEFHGNHRDCQGRWVFQYKFIGLYVDDKRARYELLRDFIRGRQRTATKLEFEKAVELRPDFYIILTNRTVTVDMVEKLRRALSEKLPTCKLVVWDSSALNGFLLGREFLARTWDGTKEAYCQSEVVAPLFQIFSNFLSERPAGVPPPHGRSPMWPVELLFEQRAVPGHSFLGSMTPTSGWRRYSAVELLAAIEARPLWGHARTVAFPNSLRDLKLLHTSMRALYDHLYTLVDGVAASLQADPIFASIALPHHDSIVAVAYTVLETAWGVPSYPPSVGLNSIQLGSVQIYQGQIPQNFVENIDKVIRELRERGVPDEVVALRSAALGRLRRCYNRLWPAAQLGIDSEPVGRRKTTSGTEETKQPRARQQRSKRK